MKEVFKTTYLQNKLEPIDDQEVEEIAPLSVVDEFGEHSYKKDFGKIELQVGKTKISLSYSSPDPDEIYKNFIEDEETKVYFFKLISVFNKTRTLDSLVLEKDGQKLDLKEAFPGGTVYFNMGNSLKSSSCIDIDKKIAFIEEDPLTPDGLLVLLHEIGHYQDFVRDSDYIKNFEMESRRSLEDEEVSEHKEWEGIGLLKNEREAWAFALKNISPFAKDLNYNLDGIDYEIHGNCLKSYSDYIREKLDN